MARDSTTSVPQLNSTDVRKVPLLKAYRIEEVYSRRRICRATVQSEEYPEWTKKLRSYKFGIAKCKPVYNAKTQTKNPPMLLWEGERYYHWQHAALLLGTSRQAVNYRMVTLSFNIPIPVIRFTLSSMALLGNALGYRWPPCHSNVVFVHESILNAVLVVPQRTLSQIERIPKHYKTRKHVVPQKDSFSEVDQDSVYEEEEEKGDEYEDDDEMESTTSTFLF